MKYAHRLLVVVIAIGAIALTIALGPSRPNAFAQSTSPAAPSPETGTAVGYALSLPARELAVSSAGSVSVSPRPRINPLAGEPDGGQRGTWNRSRVAADPLIGPPALGRTPVLDFSFEGVGNPEACNGCLPPDTNGDVGLNHDIQMVNATKVGIYDKTGTLLTPAFNLGTLWGVGTCAANAGDPVVLYDQLADRWVLSQFNSPTHMCIAISQTADPLGSYHLFTFNVGAFPDYFKLGVWPDAYYMGANEATYTSYAFDRVKMLAGDQTATFVKFTGQTNFLLPADHDGPTAPAAGSPGLFYTFKDNSFHGGSDRLELFSLHADFVNPGSSTFSLTATLPITSFTYTVCGFFILDCVRQLGTTRRLDPVSEWPMHRFPYRNFTGHQTLLGNFTVGGGSGNVGAAIRWFELRNTGTGWTLFQEGTFDLGDGHDRFMGSIAMDGSGNIALGYSVSSNTMNPAIRYATRVPGDPLGTLQAEAVLINGAGSQTGSNRWGDYSAMGIDPADDCTFYYTSEYYPVSASTTWKTRVGAFRVGCGPVAPSLSINDVTVTEGNSGTVNAVFTVTLSPSSAQTVTVQFATADGTATTAGSDYVTNSGTLTFTPGQTTQTVNVTVNGDTTVEANETFLVNLSNPTNATIADSQGVGTILNDDIVATSSLSINDVTVTEGNSGTQNAVFTVTLSPSSTQTVTVQFATANGTATAPSDYQTTSGTLTFNPGDTSKTITVRVRGDVLVEADETYFVNLSNPTNATIADGQGLGTILNNDGVATPSLSINDVTVTEGNSGTVIAAFTVTLSASSTQTVTVQFATADGTATTAGSDYVTNSGTLTFTPGQTTQTVNVTVNGDTTVEANETFLVNLSNPTNATIADSQGVGTILNDDGVVASSLSINDVTVTEGNAGAVSAIFTVTLSPSSTQTVTVQFATANGTATAVSDYQTTSGTLTFNPGETSKTITVRVKGDTVVEANETFFVNLSNPTNATIADGQGVGTILNND